MIERARMIVVRRKAEGKCLFFFDMQGLLETRDKDHVLFESIRIFWSFRLSVLSRRDVQMLLLLQKGGESIKGSNAKTAAVLALGEGSVLMLPSSERC